MLPSNHSIKSLIDQPQAFVSVDLDAIIMTFRFISSYKHLVRPYEPIHQTGPDFSLIFVGPEKSPIGEYVVQVRQHHRSRPRSLLTPPELEHNCLSLPHLVRCEPRTAAEKDPKSRQYRHITFKFENLNFGPEASGLTWVLKFHIMALTETKDGFRNVWLSTIMTDPIRVAHVSPEEAIVRAPNYCNVCKEKPCNLFLREQEEEGTIWNPHREEPWVKANPVEPGDDERIQLVSDARSPPDQGQRLIVQRRNVDDGGRG